MQHLQRRRPTKSAAALFAKIALIVAVIALLFASAADAITLRVVDISLKDVVTLLMQQSGTNVVIADSSMFEKKVSANLTEVPLENALDYLVKSAGISYRKMDDGTYIVGGVFAEEPAISKVAPELPPVEIPAPPVVKEKIYTTIKLTNSTPSEILRLLGWNGVNPNPICNPIYPDKLMGKKPEQPNGGVFVNSRDGRVFEPGKGMTMENNVPVVPTIDPTSLNPGAGRTGDQFTGIGQYSSGNVRYPGSTTRPGGMTGPGGATPAGGGQTGTTSSSTNSSNFLWPEGIDDARPFDIDNSIIVKGDEDGIEKFKKIIRMLDVPPKQVQVKAEFIEVSTTDVKTFGIDWSLQRLNESFATAFSPSGNVVVGFATGNLTAQLKTQLTSDIGRVINSPIISTINNQTAYISINRSIPYWVSVATVVGDGNIIQQSTPNFLYVSTELVIMPRVNGDGTITMMLMPQVSDTGTQVTGPDGTIIPEERTQSLYTQRRVANGETIVVGGFIRKNDSTSVQKIPILADLPIVGSLFRTYNKTTEDRELLIFVTPTIIQDVGTGTVGENIIP